LPIQLKRVYEPAAKNDGLRILVERLWPRGLSKANAKIDLWTKEIAPSTELRKWFAHAPEKWPEFLERYYSELAAQTELVESLVERVLDSKVTFVFASKEARFNNAVALKRFIESRLAK